MNKRLRIAAVAAAASLALTACASAQTGSSPSADGASYSIGIVQIISHDALDSSREGFKKALADAGLNVTYDEQNANGDQSVAASIAGTFAAADHDLILAIATPAAQAVAQAVTDTPVLFTAVTDPVGAQLVSSLDAPGGNVTGTSDANPVKEQLELIVQVVPEAHTIGVIYNSGEANSVTQVEWVKSAAAELGLEVKEATATTTGEVQQAAESLDVDAVYIPTDNTVVSAVGSVVQVGETKQIPVFAAEGNTVAAGAIATYGISYYDLGYQTGKQAARILTEGANPATMPVETQEDLALYLNLGAAQRMGVTLPQNLIDKADPENVTK
ncbi:ABC transporter substrate-binding protein [Propionicicella superfundia]|uniref:ABC transporter substrate-binding protein n=1 Tax=Propionicicella superfundia TaxID=348582 RepID=UPI000414DD0B|nr:ABC transporter substrate-binding protein [Propionicicella superfundia]